MHKIESKKSNKQARYDRWFMAKVEEALADKRPLIPHEVVVERMRKLINRK